MAIKKPDIIEHNNTSQPVVDQQNVKGGYYTVETIAERNVIPIAKRGNSLVHVIDEGLFRYKKKNDFTNTEWIKISNWEIVGDKLTASEIKAAYESEANTNAFTDADKQKLADSSNFPQPYLSTVSPPSIPPNTTGTIIIFGEYLKEDTTFKLVNLGLDSDTAHEITIAKQPYLNSTEVRLDISDCLYQQKYNLIIDNGIEVVFLDIFEISNGLIFIPGLNDWENISGSINLETKGFVKVKTKDTVGSASLKHTSFFIPKDKNYTIEFKLAISPLDLDSFFSGSEPIKVISLYNLNNVLKYSIEIDGNGTNDGSDPNSSNSFRRYKGLSSTTSDVSGFYNFAAHSANYDNILLWKYAIKRVSGFVGLYLDDLLITTFSNQFNEDLYVKTSTKDLDLVDVKFIILP